MDLESFRDLCLGLRGAAEGYPFGGDVLVFKVGGKIFALTGLADFASVNLKCDPEKGVELRERYPAVQPGYHMNKKHWITVILDGSVPDRELKAWVVNSYALVVKSLNKSDKLRLGLL